MTDRTIRFGLNYTPGRRWYYCWNDWDRAEIAADFDAMASLGIDHVRVQLIWPYFQPNPTFVSPGHLRRLDELLSIAGDRGIDVLVTLLTGFLSGYVFLPSGVKPRQVFTDARVFESQVLLAREVLRAAMPHANFMGLDVGNEINCLDHELPTEQGDDWAARFMRAVEPDLQGRLLVNGIDHTPLFRGSTFSMKHLANAYGVTSLHAWPAFTGATARGPVDAAASTHLSRFCAQFIRLWANDQDHPIWIQEFGACDRWGTIEERSRYMREGIDLAVRSGVRMFTWWCSHDKTPDLRFHEWEYSYGLFTPDNQAKELAGVFREMIAGHRGADLAAMTPGYDCAIVVPDSFAPRYLRSYPVERYIEQTLASSTWNLYDAYLAQVAAGRRPVLTREGSGWFADLPAVDLDAAALMGVA